MRPPLEELHDVLGLPPMSEADEGEVVVERDPTEVEFLSSVARLASNLKGQVFPTGNPNASLRLVGMRKPVEDPETEDFEFVLPLIVQFEGQASNAEWAVAEKAMEQGFLTAVQQTAVDFFDGEPKSRLVRRRKSDPFKNDLRSLTLLRFRVA